MCAPSQCRGEGDVCVGGEIVFLEPLGAVCGLLLNALALGYFRVIEVKGQDALTPQLSRPYECVGLNLLPSPLRCRVDCVCVFHCVCVLCVTWITSDIAGLWTAARLCAQGPRSGS